MVFYLPSTVTMDVSLTISEILSIKEWRDLEIWVWVWCRSRSLKMAWFDRSCITFYRSAIVTPVPFSSYLTLNNIVTLKSGLEFTQGHWNWCHSEVWVQFPIHLHSNYGMAVSVAVCEIFSVKEWYKPSSNLWTRLKQQGGWAYQLIGPRRALYAQLRRRHQLLRPCRALCPFHAYFRIDSACSHRQKRRAAGTANHPRRPGLSFRYTCDYGYIYHA